MASIILFFTLRSGKQIEHHGIDIRTQADAIEAVKRLSARTILQHSGTLLFIFWMTFSAHFAYTIPERMC